MNNVAVLNGGFGREIDFVGVMSMIVDQLGLSNDTKANIVQEVYNMKQGVEIARKLSSDIEKLEGDVCDLVEFKNEASKTLEKAEDFTECLFNHADAKKTLENHIHRLTYKFTGDPTELKDKLFHPSLTRNCKAHITKSLNVSEFKRIKVSDLDMAKKLADCYMTPFQVNYIIDKTIKMWLAQKVKGTLTNKIAIELLDKYMNNEAQRYADELEEKLKNM